MRRIVLALFVAFCLLPFSSAFVCDDETDFRRLPCEVISPYLDNSSCNWSESLSNNIIVENLNTSISWLIPITETNISGIYNGSFSDPTGVNFVDYSLKLCDNSTATISIINSENSYYNWGLLLMVGGLMFVFLFFAGTLKKEIGIFFILLSFVFALGLMGLNMAFVNSIGNSFLEMPSNIMFFVVGGSFLLLLGLMLLDLTKYSLNMINKQKGLKYEG